MGDKLRVLFLGTANAARSQMAEAWARHLKGDRVEAHSAGLCPQRMDPRAASAMAEVGVDMQGHAGKGLDAVRDVAFDIVVTVCPHARDTCDAYPAGTRLQHLDLPDPCALAEEDGGDEEQTMASFREVRDRLRPFIEQLPERPEA